MLVYNIVGEIHYAISVNKDDSHGQLILDKIDPSQPAQLWFASYVWLERDREPYMTLVNVLTGLAAYANGHSDSSPVCQKALHSNNIDTSTAWIPSVRNEGNPGWATLIPAYERGSGCFGGPGAENPQGTGSRWCQALNAQGNNYHPGVRIITYKLDNHYPRNSRWYFHPIVV